MHLEWLPFFDTGSTVSWLTIAVLISIAIALWLRIGCLLSIPFILGRILMATAIIALLLGPRLTQQVQLPLPNIAIALVDETASNTLGNRQNRTSAAVDRLKAQVEKLDNTELRILPFRETSDDSIVQPALAAALAAVPGKQLAGIVVIGDGDWRLNGRQTKIILPENVPFTVLDTSDPEVTDRRLQINTPPAFVHIDKSFQLTVTVDDPATTGAVPLTVTMNGEEVTLAVPVGEEINIPLTLRQAGPQKILLSIPPRDDELTPSNNKKLIEINGLRDRLQVLLVSGQPHPGGRELRALLRNDPNVDLIHFTILRSPQSIDLTPSNELALVPFPVRELFEERVGDFDLIIMDRFQRNGLLTSYYLNQIAQKANALLVIAAEETTDLAMGNLARQLLLEVDQNSSLYEARPQPSSVRHPITLPLKNDTAKSGVEWGSWLVPARRTVNQSAQGSKTLLQTTDGQPLLQIGALTTGYQQKERRLAQLASNYTWFWRRAREGNDGPQQLLLQRLISWLLKDQALEPQDLALINTNTGITAAAAVPAIATLPSGKSVAINPTVSPVDKDDNAKLTSSTVPSSIPQLADEQFTYQPVGDNIGIYTLAAKDNPKNIVYAQQGLERAEWHNLGNNRAEDLAADSNIITLANNASFTTGYSRQDVKLQRRQAVATQGAAKLQRWFWPCLALLTAIVLYGRWRTER